VSVNFNIWTSYEECNIKHNYGINTWVGVTYVHPKVQSRNTNSIQGNRGYSENGGLEKEYSYFNYIQLRQQK